MNSKEKRYLKYLLDRIMGSFKDDNVKNFMYKSTTDMDEDLKTITIQYTDVGNDNDEHVTGED